MDHLFTSSENLAELNFPGGRIWVDDGSSSIVVAVVVIVLGGGEVG